VSRRLGSGRPARGLHDLSRCDGVSAHRTQPQGGRTFVAEPGRQGYSAYHDRRKLDQSLARPGDETPGPGGVAGRTPGSGGSPEMSIEAGRIMFGPGTNGACWYLWTECPSPGD